MYFLIVFLHMYTHAQILLLVPFRKHKMFARGFLVTTLLVCNHKRMASSEICARCLNKVEM